MADPTTLAITVAIDLAQMGLQASQRIEGPHLTDLKATVADYGTPANYVYGTRAIQCPVIFAEEIQERKNTRKGKSGKQTTYTGYGTFAVHLADHQMVALRRMWFDNHLIYDATGSGAVLFPLGSGYELTSYMRVYYGTEDQDPDPRMLATVEAKRAPGTCPAYKGQAYVMFEDIPLEQLGNRYPQVRAEIATVAGSGTFVIPAGAVAEVAWQQATFEQTVNDQARMGIAFLDNSGVVLGSTTWATLTDPSPSMHFVGRTVSAAAPSGAARIRVYMEMVRRTGTNNDGYIDEIELTLDGVPVGLINSGAETGTTTGWTNEVGAIRTRSSDPAPAFGSHYFTGGTSSTARAYQDVVPDLPAAVTLGGIVADVARRAGLDADEYDFTALDQAILGHSWTIGDARQIVEPLLTAHASQVRPHDFLLEGIKRGASPGASIDSSTFTADDASVGPYKLKETAERELPSRLTLNFADVDTEQQPNTAITPGPRGTVSSREQLLDMGTTAMTASEAKQLLDRYMRRLWFARKTAELGLTRSNLALEPGDVHTLILDGAANVMDCDRWTLGADGAIATEWEQDDPALAGLSGAAGAVAGGYVPSEVYDPAGTVGEVLDLPMLNDADDQAAPFAYLAASPAEDGKPWAGASFAASDTGDPESYTEGWGVISPDRAAAFGTVTEALPSALPWVPDNGSSITVTLVSGTLAGATMDQLESDASRNLAAIGGELLQFSSATLTAPLTYTLTGLLRGRKGTEAAIAGHAPAERFVLLDGTAVKRTLGASEIGDTDWYVASTAGSLPDETAAVSMAFTARAHRPYSPVNGTIVASGSDYLINARRRTRIGGSSVNGQDVPLGEASESWEADIMNGSTVVRTLAGTSLPLTYTAANIATDWGGPWGTPVVNLYQKNPTLNLRGMPLNITG
jgi:hypothetical protein